MIFSTKFLLDHPQGLHSKYTIVQTFSSCPSPTFARPRRTRKVRRHSAESLRPNGVFFQDESPTNKSRHARHLSGHGQLSAWHDTGLISGPITVSQRAKNALFSRQLSGKVLSSSRWHSKTLPFPGSSASPEPLSLAHTTKLTDPTTFALHTSDVHPRAAKRERHRRSISCMQFNTVQRIVEDKVSSFA